jgi:transposase
MDNFYVSGPARKTQEKIAQSGSDARMVRRAQALVWLSRGESIAETARRLGISRYAVYQIVERYQARSGEPVAERLRDRPHTGRPAAKRTEVQAILTDLLQTTPADYGYRAFAWTTPLLRTQVERRLHGPISQRTIRRALRALRYRYKRPRYSLARRSSSWRQAKGGSSAA